MDEANKDISGFLTANGWGDARQDHLAGDMSNRAYIRLHLDGKSAILMHAQTDQHAFLKMTAWLQNIGLTAPTVIAANQTAKLLLLEDLGPVSLKTILSTEQGKIYHDLIRLLLKIRKADPPNLSQPTAGELVDWTSLADHHYPGIRSKHLTGFRSILRRELETMGETRPCVSLRDFHSENIQWCAERTDLNRFGLLDYQDAFIAHPVYDLMSMLTDARMEVSTETRDTVINMYSAQSGDCPAGLRRAFFVFSAQRNLRILGIFARSGKRANAMLLAYRYLLQALEHEVFASVRDEALMAVPSPIEASQ